MTNKPLIPNIGNIQFVREVCIFFLIPFHVVVNGEGFQEGGEERFEVGEKNMHPCFKK